MQQLILTGGDDGDFSAGLEPSMYTPLIIIYVLCTFFMIVHMMNMLIAIMGEAFSENREEAAILQQRERLRFIIDKWFFRKSILYKSIFEFIYHYLFRRSKLLDFSQMNYIIAAFLEEELGQHGN